MQKNIILLLIYCLFTVSAHAADTVEMDFSQYKVSHSSATKAAAIAFIKADWDVDSLSADKAVGNLKNGAYVVEIDYSAIPKILIRSTKGRTSSKYLERLKREMLVAMVSCN